MLHNVMFWNVDISSQLASLLFLTVASLWLGWEDGGSWQAPITQSPVTDCSLLLGISLPETSCLGVTLLSLAYFT